MKIMFFGAPGAGKGTQADKTAERLGIPTISTGAIIREEMKNGDDCRKFAWYCVSEVDA